MIVKATLLRALFFFVFMLIINLALNHFMALGQTRLYMLQLTFVATTLYCFLMVMRSRWSK